MTAPQTPNSGQSANAVSVGSTEWFCGGCGNTLTLINDGHGPWQYSAACKTCENQTRWYIDPETALMKLGSKQKPQNNPLCVKTHIGETANTTAERPVAVLEALR